MFGYAYNLEYVCSLTVNLRWEAIGRLPTGIRTNACVMGGQMDGPNLHGKIRPGGADFLILRHDGVAVLDIRAVWETQDGALIDVVGSGLGYSREDAYERASRGDLPSTVPLRVAMYLSTAHPDYVWVNRLQFLSIQEADITQGEVRGDLYAVR